MANDDHLLRRFVEETGARMPSVIEAFTLLLERSWPVQPALEDLREAARVAARQEVACARLLAAFDAVHARHGTAMFWWKDETSRFLGFCPRVALASGLEARWLVGETDADPRVAWNRQAALYARDDRDVMSSGTPRFDIVERQDRQDGTVWLRTSKVPYSSNAGAGTVGGLDTISGNEAQRLTKLAR
ncbi:MAG: hypothetical protein J0L92_05880 [Deltaproteobacteria bacterium]|nr:hypothetical protein [Deltaproteobacteria bacterium]